MNVDQLNAIKAKFYAAEGEKAEVFDVMYEHFGDLIREIGRLWEKIDSATDKIKCFGGIGGGHHKQWVLDQVIRHLVGDGYDEWVKQYEHGAEGPKSYQWDVGIAP